MKEIEKIKKNYKNILFIFEFYDQVALKLRKVSLGKKDENTLTFFDYYTNEEYYITDSQLNSILDYCYNEYFFKIVLSGCSYYQKVKKICDDMEIEPPIYDLFFRSFFLAIKDRYSCLHQNNNAKYIKNIVRRIIFRSYEDTFEYLPRVDIDYYIKQAEKILLKLEKSGLIFYDSNDITRDLRIRSYFPISCDTFKFEVTDDFNGYGISMPMFDYLDLKNFLDSQIYEQKDLLTVMDRAVQSLVIMSFKNAKYRNSEYSDNSFIKQIRLAKKNKNA